MPLTEPTYLFEVKDSFLLTGIALLLIPDRQYKSAKLGDKLLLIRPGQFKG